VAQRWRADPAKAAAICQADGEELRPHRAYLISRQVSRAFGAACLERKPLGLSVSLTLPACLIALERVCSR
jgi:hypothetical protein